MLLLRLVKPNLSSAVASAIGSQTAEIREPGLELRIHHLLRLSDQRAHDGLVAGQATLTQEPSASTGDSL